MKNKGIEKIQSVFWVLLFITITSFYYSMAEAQVIIEQTGSTTFPVIIDQPGNYLLMTDLVISTPDLHAIQINADEVVLNLNTHTISGPGQASGSEGCGIYSLGKNNISITNGTIEGFLNGLFLSGTNHEIKNIKSYENIADGFDLESSTITDCRANNNRGHGFEVKSCTINNCTASHNSVHGFKVESCTLNHCTVDNNSSHGINASDKCQITGCELTENGGYGLYLAPDYSYVIENRASHNALGNFYSDGVHYMPIIGDDANCEF